MANRDTAPEITVSFSEGSGEFRSSSRPRAEVPAPPPSPVRIFQSVEQMGATVSTGTRAVRQPDRTLAGLRPRDDSSGAIRDALHDVALARQAAVDRVAIARDNRRRALTDPAATSADVEAFGRRAAEAGIELERLSALEPELEAKLGIAIRREAAARLAVDVARADHAAAAEAMAKALPGYRKAAEQVVRLCELVRTHDAALAALKQAAAVANVSVAPAVDAPDAGFLAHVVLPAPGGGTLWGELPKPPLHHPFLNSQRGPYG